MKFARLAPFAAALALVAGSVRADETLVRVNTFPTARSLPFFVGVEKGIFRKHGIRLEFEFTESSKAQRDGLASGKFEVVHSAVDNALAMIETAHVDVVIVSGGDGGTNEFIVGKDIKSFAAYVGGSPTNIAVGAQRLGLRTAVLTALGEDPVADFILNFLKQEGVETKFIPNKRFRN